MKYDKVTEIGSVDDMLSAIMVYDCLCFELEPEKTFFGGGTGTSGVKF